MVGPMTQGRMAQESKYLGCILSAEGDHRKALSIKVTSLFLKILFWLLSKEEIGKEVQKGRRSHCKCPCRKGVSWPILM